MPQQKSVPATIKVFDETVSLLGHWDINGIAKLARQLKKTRWPATNHIIFDGSNIAALDTCGAWEFQQLQQQLLKRGFKIESKNFTEAQQALLTLIENQTKQIEPLKSFRKPEWLARLGKRTIDGIKQAIDYLAFIGESMIVTLRSLRNLRAIHWRSLFYYIETTGFQALPIIALLSFMIGVVIAYQMGIQLRNYGANIFIVDLLGASILREFSSLLTAILVAGRSGSAFTAQIGTMRINEEIDALSTMGLHPIELLIMPRLLALVIVMPLLTLWSNFFGVLGGMVVAKSMLHINYYDFVQRFQAQVSINSLLIGLGKAPVFALIIASVGCFQGLQVRGSAESVGKKTTTSVVQSIFAIIVVDALFSILFSKFNL